jgi:hypothetical protein
MAGARHLLAAGRGVILALDCGTNTGAAIRGADGRIALSTPTFDDRGGYGLRYLKFRVWLTETKNRLGGIDAVFYEKITFAANVRSARLMWGMEAHLCAWCEHHQIPYVGVNVSTLKLFMTGNGKAKKPEVVASARARGFAPSNDNEADALAALLWGMEQIDWSVAA